MMSKLMEKLTMTNDAYTEKISLWLDGQLSPNEVADLKDHMTTCPTCRQTYQAMQKVDRLLKTAGKHMAAPGPGFPQRVEARLARYQPHRPWQIWLAVAALLLGTLFIFVAWGVLGGITLVGAGLALLDVDVLYQGVAGFIQSVDNLRVFLNLGGLFLKASLITMQQPLFWGCVLLALILIGGWVRAIQKLAQRAVASVELVL